MVATHSRAEHEASVERTSSTVNKIEHELGSNHTDHISSHTRDQIYKDLHHLSQHDSHFKEDLSTINAKLQHDGYLPNLYIVGNDGSHVQKEMGIGPGGKDGFHLSDHEYKPAPLAPEGTKPTEAPTHAPTPAGQDQGTWHRNNPGNPVGSTGGEGNVGGSTPIDTGAVTSNPVAGGALGNSQLMSEVHQALQLLNAQRAAQGLPPIADNAQNDQAIMTIIQHESGGDPNAQNNSDSNAAAGDPSRGLMQTIGTTFSAYHVQGTSNNIFDPVANIAAGINYAVSRYGSLEQVPGVVAVNEGKPYVGY